MEARRGFPVRRRAVAEGRRGEEWGGKEKGLEAATVALVLCPQVSSCTPTSRALGLPSEGTFTPFVLLPKLLVMAPRARQHGTDLVILQRHRILFWNV